MSLFKSRAPPKRVLVTPTASKYEIAGALTFRLQKFLPEMLFTTRRNHSFLVLQSKSSVAKMKIWNRVCLLFLVVTLCKGQPINRRSNGPTVKLDRPEESLTKAIELMESAVNESATFINPFSLLGQARLFFLIKSKFL